MDWQEHYLTYILQGLSSNVWILGFIQPERCHCVDFTKAPESIRTSHLAGQQLMGNEDYS